MTFRTWAALVSLAALLSLPDITMGESSASPVTPSSQTSGIPADTNDPGNGPPPGQDSGTSHAAKDTLTTPKSRADTVLVVKHTFDHKEQIITGSVVMTCLALMMVIMNNYNPR